MALMFKCNQHIVKPVEYQTLTVRLNLNDPDPTTWAEYCDDAIGMTPGSDDFDTFFGHYPCILQNGEELGTLQRNNFGKYVGGSTAPISAVGKDVMIAFPRRGYKITRSGSYVYVSITGRQNAEGYSYKPFSYCGNPCSKIYIGAYIATGNTVNDVYALYSSTTGDIHNNNTLYGTRDCVHERGANFELWGYYQLVYLQAMFLIKYLGQNFQNITGSPNGNLQTIGQSNTLGMDVPYGGLAKMFGLEAITMPLRYTYVDGIFAKSLSSTGKLRVYASDGNYNDDGTGYTQILSLTPTNPNSGAFSSVIRYINGSNDAGFLPSSSTSQYDYNCFFCGGATIYPNYALKLGLSTLFNVVQHSSGVGNDTWSRIMYFKQGE